MIESFVIIFKDGEDLSSSLFYGIIAKVRKWINVTENLDLK